MERVKERSDTLKTIEKADPLSEETTSPALSHSETCFDHVTSDVLCKFCKKQPRMELQNTFDVKKKCLGRNRDLYF